MRGGGGGDTYEIDKLNELNELWSLFSCLLHLKCLFKFSGFNMNILEIIASNGKALVLQCTIVPMEWFDQHHHPGHFSGPWLHPVMTTMRVLSVNNTRNHCTPGVSHCYTPMVGIITHNVEPVAAVWKEWQSVIIVNCVEFSIFCLVSYLTN